MDRLGGKKSQENEDVFILPYDKAMFENVDQLMYVGKYKEALQNLNALTGRTLGPADVLKCTVLRSRCLIGLDKHDAALELITHVVEQERDIPNIEIIIVEALESWASVLIHTGQYDDGLERIEQGEEMLQSLAQDKSPVVKRLRAALLRLKAEYYLRKGDQDSSLESIKQSLALYEEIGDKLGIARCLQVMGGGGFYDAKGDRKQQFDYLQQSLALYEEVGNRMGVALLLFSIGHHYITVMGDIKKSLEYMHRSMTLYEEMGQTKTIMYFECIINLGWNNQQLGELDTALGYYQSSLALAEEMGHKDGIATSIKFISHIQYFKGEVELAIDLNEQSLSMFEETGNIPFVIWGLLDLILDFIGIIPVEKTQMYLQRMREVNQQLQKQGENRVMDQYCRLAEAGVLKTSTRARDRGKAEEILEQLLEEGTDDIVTKVALLFLCELLLVDLQLSGNENVLEEVKTHLDRLHDTARDQHSHWWLAEVYVLQSRLALWEFDMQRARQLLTQAQRIADEKGLDQLAVTISNDHDSLLDELDKWKQLKEQGGTLAERAELARLGEQIDRMLHAGKVESPELPDEAPILLLILHGGGISLFIKKFDSVTDVDEQMIGAFLNAIQSFSEEVFSQTLDRIRLKEYTILVRPQGEFSFCYVYRGQSYSAQQKLTRFVEIVPQKSSIWTPLQKASRTGQVLDSTALASIDTLLSEVFVDTYVT